MNQNQPPDPTQRILDTLLGQIVVLDMVSPYTCIGTLSSIDHLYVTLTDVDIHDLRDSSTSREVYVREVRVHGVAPNRNRAFIRQDQVVSVSALADVHT